MIAVFKKIIEKNKCVAYMEVNMHQGDLRLGRIKSNNAGHLCISVETVSDCPDQ